MITLPILLIAGGILGYGWKKKYQPKLTNDDTTETLIRLNNIHYMIKCGIHSGFLPCCIKFYTTQYTWKDKKTQRYATKIEKRCRSLGIKTWGYIPCPNCLKAGHVVKVKPCPKGSRCWFVDELPDDQTLYSTLTQAQKEVMGLTQTNIVSLQSSIKEIREIITEIKDTAAVVKKNTVEKPKSLILKNCWNVKDENNKDTKKFDKTMG